MGAGPPLQTTQGGSLILVISEPTGKEGQPRRAQKRGITLTVQSNQPQVLPSFAILTIALRLSAASSSVVAQLETLMRMAVCPCHCVPPHQQVPSACIAAMTRRGSSGLPKHTSTCLSTTSFSTSKAAKRQPTARTLRPRAPTRWCHAHANISPMLDRKLPY